ncbi:hypothetical protein Scep_025501 [Stephania cephalantha]|uniref:Uncharacterized protein n=1 Tax=Stephania cephalantha TaxID=152367 RepID=A0AAP0HR92_9MAGN
MPSFWLGFVDIRVSCIDELRSCGGVDGDDDDERAMSWSMLVSLREKFGLVGCMMNQMRRASEMREVTNVKIV